MLYTKKLEEFVDSFCTKHQLLNQSKKHLLSISGGVDSIVLFQVFLKLKLPFEVIHFNHGTREACEKEAEFVQHLCRVHSILFHVVNLQMDINLSNFESRARNLRQRFYRQFINQGFTVVCAHHLDDAFEWHLMQKFKQSSLKKLLGIPVKNNGVIRPFLCLSKKQIYDYAIKNQLTWFEDVSNQNIKFERNFMRLKIVELIKKQYPNYLQQFVSQQQNLLALYHSKNSDVTIKAHQMGGIVVKADDLTFHHDRILEVIESLSNAQRGKLSKTLKQLFNSYLMSKSDVKKHLFFGPFKFSGGVFAVLYGNCIYFYTEQEEAKWKLVDKDYVVDQYSAQITYGLLNKTDLSYFPNIHLKYGRKSKLVFPLLSGFLNQQKQSDILFSYLV